MVKFKAWIRKEQAIFVASVTIVAHLHAWAIIYMLSAYGFASALIFSLVFVGPAISFGLMHRVFSMTPEERERLKHREEADASGWFDYMPL